MAKKIILLAFLLSIIALVGFVSADMSYNDNNYHHDTNHDTNNHYSNNYNDQNNQQNHNHFINYNENLNSNNQNYNNQYENNGYYNYKNQHQYYYTTQYQDGLYTNLDNCRLYGSHVSCLTSNQYQSRSVIIIVGRYADSSDYNYANQLSNNLKTANYNPQIVTDNNYNDDGYSNVISIGGPCVNKISAGYMGVSYPTCGSYFSQISGVYSGNYMIKSYQMPNNRMAIVIAGYDTTDTQMGEQYYMMNMGNYGMMNYMGNSGNSYNTNTGYNGNMGNMMGNSNTQYVVGY